MSDGGIEPFLELLKLKDLLREGWRLRGIREPESVADHSWGTALLVLRHAESAGVETGHALALAIVHDLIEVRVGDIPRRADPAVPRVEESEKRLLEKRAASELATEQCWPELETLWEEYDNGASAAARLVRDMNLLDMVLQATLYSQEMRWEEARGAERFPTYPGLDEFFETSRPRVTTEVGKRLFEETEALYRRDRPSVQNRSPETDISS